jgi:hypothetical protein
LAGLPVGGHLLAILIIVGLGDADRLAIPLQLFWPRH